MMCYLSCLGTTVYHSIHEQNRENRRSRHPVVSLPLMPNVMWTTPSCPYHQPPLVSAERVAGCGRTLRSCAMEDEEANISIHHPSARMTLVLNLVVGPEMPLAVELATPERIVVACICWPNLARVVRSTLSRDPPILHLDVFARGTLLCVTVNVCWPCLSDRPWT